MDAVTYPNAKVIDFLQDKVIPLQLTSNAKPESDDYNVKWTPHLAILDADGKEHHRSLGFCPRRNSLRRPAGGRQGRVRLRQIR